MVVPAATAWAGCFLVTGEEWRWACLGALAGLAALGVGVQRAQWLVAAGGLMLAGTVMVAGLQVWALQSSTLGRLSSQGASVTVLVQVQAEPAVTPASGVRPALARMPVQVRRLDGRGRRTVASVPGRLQATGESVVQLQALPVGSEVLLSALVRPPRPGERSAATLVLRGTPEIRRGPGPADRVLNRVRAGLRASMRHNPPEQAGLVPAFVVGDTAHVPGSVTDDFKTTGLTHLTAVSGTNLTLLLAFSLGLLRRAGVQGWWLRGAAVGMVAVFVMLCRSEPSVLRAAAMGLVALSASGLARDQRRGVRNLAVACCGLLLVDPWLARSWGFALSVSASLGILCWAGPWQQRLMRWAPEWVAEAVCVPLAAQLATQPIVTALSGSISVVGLASNALTGPFVAPVTVLGLTAALVSPVWSPAGVVPGWLAGWCVQPVLTVAHLFAGLPAAQWAWRSSPTALAVLAACCLGLATVLPWVLARPAWCLVFAVALVVAGWRQPAPAGWPGQWQVVFCDVGQGDATVIRAGPHQVVLVDTGPDSDQVVACLRGLGVKRVPLLVLSHFHSDHIGGLSGVLRSFEVGEVLTSPLAEPADQVALVRGQLAEAQVPSRPARVQERLSVGEATWQTLAAGPAAGLARQGEGENSAENDSSVVGLVGVGGVRVLMTGDAEPPAQQALVASGVDLSAHVLKLPHHGSSRQDERFFQQSAATLAIASVGERNDYGHPAAKTVSLANKCGMKVLRTDQTGSVAVGRDARGMRIVTERPAGA